MEELVPNNDDNKGYEFDAVTFFNNLESSDLGPFHEKETIFNNAREEMLSQFSDLVAGKGGDSLQDAIDTYNVKLNNMCDYFDDMVNFAYDNLGDDAFIQYYADRFVTDEKLRFDRMLEITGATYDDPDIKLELVTYEDAKLLATDFADAKQLLIDDPEYENDGNSPSPEYIIDLVGSIYRESVAEGFDELSQYIPSNIHDENRAQQKLQNETREFEELRRKEKISSFLTQIATTAIGTSIAIFGSQIIKKLRHTK